jgi:hypothetical protein
VLEGIKKPTKENYLILLERFKFSILETFFGSKVIPKVKSVFVDLAAVLARVRGRLEQ